MCKTLSTSVADPKMLLRSCKREEVSQRRNFPKKKILRKEVFPRDEIYRAH